MTRTRLLLLALALAVAGALLVFVFNGEPGTVDIAFMTNVGDEPKLFLWTDRIFVGSVMMVLTGLLMAGVAGHYLARREPS